MTPVMTAQDFSALGAPDLVYVREILAKDVIDDIEDVDVELKPDQVLYALHGADGERLAVMLDRATAFAAAQAHDMAPVSVH
ncbi:DUF1150 family protein [uncultured Brevundimonas sp.]|uniref:DUF1150 family protein n=1 Tax=uncultured Brevundimonas sp. TaxID=213418 RepID=UPI002637C44E|nr:DUF1150 family protein [uncultured Brevundimonas sp.]